MFSRRARAHRRIAKIAAELPGLRAELAGVEEEVIFLSQVEADAKVAGLVGDPGQAREHAVAERDLRRARDVRDRLVAAIEAKQAAQDDLLDRLADL